ncbi:hypothetical protein GCM10027299_10950 [Larkinella ripae]
MITSFFFRRLFPALPAISWLMAVVGLTACQTGTELPSAGYDYQPLEPGHYWIYDVSEQRFSLNGAPTTQTYQLREIITHAYTAITEETLYRVERHRRASDSQPWQPDSVGSLQIREDQLIKTENNRSYVKLVFPVIDQFQWNGNAFNANGEDLYQVKNAGKPYAVLNQPFTETATVVQQNDSTLVSQDKRLEVYARQVGLIYKETVQLQFCSSTPACIGKAQIDYGFRRYLRLRSYGKE